MAKFMTVLNESKFRQNLTFTLYKVLKSALLVK